MNSISAVCRTCLKLLDDNCPKFDLNFVESAQDFMPVGLKLGACFPDMNLYITEYPVICKDCFTAILFVHKFKEKCMKTEARIQEYLQRSTSNLSFVDLQEVVTVNEEKKCNVTDDNVDERKCKINIEQTSKQLKIINTESVNTVTDKCIVGQTEQFKSALFKNDGESFHYSKNDKASTKIEPHTNTIKVQWQATSKTKSNISKLYKCTICEFSSNTKGNLKMHMQIHTGEKRYKCTDCNYESLQKIHLVVHMRRHTGEKPYKCSECSYRCRQPTNLNAHMNQHHFASLNMSSVYATLGAHAFK